MHSNDRRVPAVIAAAVAAGALALAAAPADAAVAPAIKDRVLTVTGDAAADTLTLRVPASAPTQLELDVGDNGTADFRFPRAAFDQVRVLAGGGADLIRIENAAVRGAAPLPVAVEGEGGNDTLLGNATFEGGDGFDRFGFTGSDAVDDLRLAANGTRALLTRAGAVAGNLGGVERVDLEVRGGNDLVTVDDLTGTGVQEAHTDLRATGDSGADRLVLNGTPKADFISVLGSAPTTTAVLGLPAFVTVTGAESARDSLFLNSLAGDDQINATTGGSTPRLIVDGGADGDAISGTSADDVLNGGAGRDSVDGRGGNDIIGLGADDDRVTYTVGGGTDTVQGGTGRDTAFVSGSSANEQLAVEGSGPRMRVRRNGAVAVDTELVEALSVFSFGGADTVAVGDVTGTPLDTITASLFDFSVPGGANDVVTVAGTAANDTVTVTGSGTTATVTGLQAKLNLNGIASDRLEVNTGGGNDSVDSTALPATPLQLRADGGAGDDVLVTGAGDDVVSGGDGADVLFAGGGDNVAFGGAGDDVLRGEEGDDVLDGGAGDDVLIGNAGDDVLLNGEVVFDE